MGQEREDVKESAIGWKSPSLWSDGAWESFGTKALIQFCYDEKKFISLFKMLTIIVGILLSLWLLFMTTGQLSTWGSVPVAASSPSWGSSFPFLPSSLVCWFPLFAMYSRPSSLVPSSRCFSSCHGLLCLASSVLWLFSKSFFPFCVCVCVFYYFDGLLFILSGFP